MSVQRVVDMNLSPDWVSALTKNGWSAVHWSSVGAVNADDSTVMAWARSNGYVVLTHDLDFGTALALTHAAGPSVIQIRAQDVMPEHAGPLVIAAVQQHNAVLSAGALIVIDEAKTRVRVLPF